MLKLGQIVNVQAYKHDGTLYRQWNGAKVIEISPHSIVLFMFKTKVAELAEQKWIVREPILWWFPRDRFFNTTALIRQSGTYFYTNIASPPIFEDNTMKFIDYDLDVKAYPDMPVKIVDRGEYERHKIKFSYSKKLDMIVERSLKEVTNLIKNNDEYFDEEVVSSYVEDLIKNKMLGQKFTKGNR